MERPSDDSSARAAEFIGRVMRRFDLGDRWAFHALHDDGRCYGMTEAELGPRTPSLPHSTTLQKREIETLADYLLAKIIRRGPVTRAECLEALGERARSCSEIAQ